VISPHDAVQNHPLGTQAAPVCEGGVFAHRGADHRWLLTRSWAGRTWHHERKCRAACRSQLRFSAAAT